jgi:hypothetical protein
MLKKFSFKKPNFGGVGGIKCPGLWQRFCCRMYRCLWQMFALSALLLFGFLLWNPNCYLMIVLFLQVLGLIIWLQVTRF